jgi:regulatory protein
MDTGTYKTAPQPVRRRRRGPAPVTPESLEHAARRHLERYATSSQHLKRILLKRVERAERLQATAPRDLSESGPARPQPARPQPQSDFQAARAAIDGIVARLIAAGAIDDQAYADSVARSQARKGASRRAILARLAAKGLGRAERERALDKLGEAHADPELAAAVAYARRRRLGPFRPEAARAERRERDLAALSRRGFAPELAIRVIDAPDPEALQDEAGGR